MVMSIMRLDFRAPQNGAAEAREIYATALDMGEWADEQGFTMLVLPEHHGIDDGYLPSPLTMAGCLAGRTKRVRIGVMALLLNLYDPVRLAEDLAVLDLASGGRMAITLGQGYRTFEYDAMGADWDARGRDMDEAIELLLRAWRGERFEWRGRPVHVTPRPMSEPHPFIAVGGRGRNAARRAARFGLPLQPSIDDPAVRALYTAECERLGQVPVYLPVGSGVTTFLSEDPDRTWSEIGPYLLHHATDYASWQTPEERSAVNSTASTVAELRSEGLYRVITPDDCVAAIEATPHHAIVFLPLCGGMPPDLAWPSLRLYAEKVLPRVR